ncbi:MAG: hypothetical protein ACREUY_09675 [Burkholderiales bacterium]
MAKIKYTCLYCDAVSPDASHDCEGLRCARGLTALYLANRDDENMQKFLNLVDYSLTVKFSTPRGSLPASPTAL